jgi:hypothetical protein
MSEEAERFRVALDGLGLTGAMLARAGGWNRATVRRWAAGQTDRIPREVWLVLAAVQELQNATSGAPADILEALNRRGDELRGAAGAQVEPGAVTVSAL